MSQYDRQIKNAIKMIQRYGQKCTWIKPGESITVDDQQPWKTTSTASTSKDVYIVFIRANGFSRELYRLMKGTDIATGTPKGLMAQVPFTPEMEDIVDRGGVKMKIESLDPIAPSGIPIAWIINFSS